MNYNVERFNCDEKLGLSNDQVNLRQSQKLTNKTKIVVGKSYWQIIRDDVFSFFNILLFVIASFIIYRNAASGGTIKWWEDLFFLGVLFLNIAISLYQDLKARHLMSKLRVVTSPRACVIRNRETLIIKPEDIVLDDITYLTSESQICADSIIVSGTVNVNESLLTGEPKSIFKKPGDILLSGSFIVNGSCYARVDKVGSDSYIETVQNKANKFARSPSKILNSLRNLFKVIGTIVIALAITMIVIAAVQQKFSSPIIFLNTIGSISGSLVGMIPAGLYLLTSVALAVGVISLVNKRARVQDFYSIEMLSRADVLCVDKTGTITDGSLKVRDILKLDDSFSLDDIKSILKTIVIETRDNNKTAQALKAYSSHANSLSTISNLPFESANKYSAVSLNDETTYIMGALEFINVVNKTSLIETAKEYTSLGYRVLLLAKGNSCISGKQYNDSVRPVGLIILEDHIRDEAKRTFEWFNQNGVEIKVISGDDALTVSEIARQAGIQNSDKYISLENMSLDEVFLIADQYTVFGRVTPEQKDMIIKSLKEKKKTVAMTGDGVNDILALKRADCSIAMASGAEAAKNVSHIVLLDSNFDTLPDVVGEGRRVVNNLQRTSSLFLVKTLTVMVLSLTFIIISCVNGTSYPFKPSHLTLWEMFTIGLSAFFLALEPNHDISKDGFIRNILKNAIPSAILILGGIFTIFVLYLFNSRAVIFTGIGSWEVAISMAAITFTLLSVVILFDVCRPFSKYRAIVFTAATLIVIALLLSVGLTSYYKGLATNFFSIRFDLLSPLNLLTIGITTVVWSTLYFAGRYIVRVVKGNKTYDKN